MMLTMMMEQEARRTTERMKEKVRKGETDRRERKRHRTGDKATRG